MKATSSRYIFTGLLLSLMVSFCPVLVRAEDVKPSAESAVQQDRDLESSVGHVVLSTVRGAGTVAKGGIKVLGRLMQIVQAENEKKDLAQQFYAAFDQSYTSMNMDPADYEAVRARVTGVYVEEDKDHLLGLDLLTFSDMPHIILREDAALKLLSARNGEFKTYFADGSVETIRRFENGKLNGRMVTYYEDGAVKFLDYYENGEIQLRKKFTPEGKLDFEQDYRTVNLYEEKIPLLETPQSEASPPPLAAAAVPDEVKQDDLVLSGAPQQATPRIA